MAKSVELRAHTRIIGGAKKALLSDDPDGGVEVVVRVNILPRGSGNRAFARAVAKSLRDEELLKPHVKRIRVGASSVIVHFRPTFEAYQAIQELRRRAREAMDTDQLRLAF